MEKRYPVIILRNCLPDDDTKFWLEVKGDGKTMPSVYQEVGEFVMRSLQYWQRRKRQYSTDPHIHVEPSLMTRFQIDSLEVETLINDPSTFTIDAD